MELTNVIKKPWISEKSADLSNAGQYAFIVEPAARAKQIKDAIEKIYKVHVTRINVVRNAKKNFKKAIVTLKKGESIDIIPR